MGRADGALLRVGGSKTILINGWGGNERGKERECKNRAGRRSDEWGKYTERDVIKEKKIEFKGRDKRSDKWRKYTKRDMMKEKGRECKGRERKRSDKWGR